MGPILQDWSSIKWMNILHPTKPLITSHVYGMVPYKTRYKCRAYYCILRWLFVSFALQLTNVHSSILQNLQAIPWSCQFVKQFTWAWTFHCCSLQVIMEWWKKWVHFVKIKFHFYHQHCEHFYSNWIVLRYENLLVTSIIYEYSVWGGGGGGEQQKKKIV